MFTSFTCPTCSRELMQKGTGAYPLDESTGYVARVHISTTEPARLVRCANGHDSLLVVYDPGFSLLYQRALQRLATGDLRDTVIDAQTALEMFLAHVPVRASYDRTGAKPSEIRAARKRAGMVSAERIYGAAVVCASVLSCQPPVIIDTDKTQKVRNNAVHNGVEPTEPEAEALCLEVERVVLVLLEQLDTQKSVAAEPYFQADWRERIEDFVRQLGDKKYAAVSNNSLSTVFGFNVTPRPEARKVLAAYREAHAEGDDYWPVW